MGCRFAELLGAVQQIGGKPEWHARQDWPEPTNVMGGLFEARRSTGRRNLIASPPQRPATLVRPRSSVSRPPPGVAANHGGAEGTGGGVGGGGAGGGYSGQGGQLHGSHSPLKNSRQQHASYSHFGSSSRQLSESDAGRSLCAGPWAPQSCAIRPTNSKFAEASAMHQKHFSPSCAPAQGVPRTNWAVHIGAGLTQPLLAPAAPVLFREIIGLPLTFDRSVHPRRS